MTGAEKLMFGMFAGWKDGGNPPVLNVCGCCIPGAAELPSGGIPGMPRNERNMSMTGKQEDTSVLYPFQAVPRSREDHLAVPGMHQN